MTFVCAAAVPAAAQTQPGAAIKMRIAKSRVTYDKPVIAFGRLGSAYAGREVQLESRTSAGAWQPLARATVAPDGRWRIAAKLSRTSTVRVTLQPAPDAATAASDAPRSAERNVAVTARVNVARRRLDVRAGRRALVRGRTLPAARGRRVALQVRRHGRWVTVARDRTARDGAFRLRERARTPMDTAVRVAVRKGRGLSQALKPLGRLQVYRYAHASWYGPGFWGRQTGCGGRLGYSQHGVAHKTLPCGTRVTLRHRGRSVRVPVIDRGPYAGNREFDLTAVTARKLRFRGHGTILVTR